MPSVFAFLRPRLAAFFGGRFLSSMNPRQALVAIALFFCAVAYVASLGGDFPLNDDWAYGESTRVFLESGRLYMPAACAAGVAHILWGAFFAKIFGFSYVVLRFSSLIAGAIGAYFAYLTLIEMGVHRRESLFCTLVYAANPIMINLYLGFMSDIPALSLGAGYLFCLLAGIKRKSLKHLTMALLLLILAVTIRQSAVVLALAAPAILFARIGTFRQRLVLAVVMLLISLATFWAVDAWLMQRDATGQSIVDHYSAARIGHRAFVLGFLHTPLQQCLKSISALGVVTCYLGLFTAPIVLSGCACALACGRGLADIKVFLSRRRPVLAALGLSLLVCLLSAYFETSVLHALMPFCENILRITSVGALAIMGIANQLLTPRQKIRLTIVSYLLAWLVLAQLISLIMLAIGHISRLIARAPTRAPTMVPTGSPGANPSGSPAATPTGTSKQSGGAPFNRYLPAALVVVMASACATMGFLTVETVVRCTDRYYLIALLPVILALAYFARIGKMRYASPFGFVLLAIFLWYGLAAGQDYISSNSARWRALVKLEAQGVSPTKIDGGAEYNVLRDINVYASHYRGQPPRDNWRWWPIRGEDYIVSFSPVPDYQEKWQEKYFSLLTMTEHQVYVLEHLKLNK